MPDPTHTILVVEDDPIIVRTLRISLRAHGYTVLTAGDGRTALQIIADEPISLVLLDLGLPDVDGVQVLRQIRADGRTVPVVVLSARREQDDKVEALDEGADDYVTKPFGMEELLARVRAGVRRGAVVAVTMRPLPVVTPDFSLDFETYEALARGVAVHLTPTEWRLLAELANNAGRVVDHQQLLRAAWGPGYGRESNYLRVYTNQLRRKLEPDPSHPKYIVTEPGLGYSLRA